MKTILLVLFGFFFCSTRGNTQDCNPAEVTKQAGKWKPGMQGNTNGVSAASLAKQKEIVGQFVKRLQQNMNLEGFNLNYSGVYGYDNPALYKHRKADAYELSMAVLPLYCENGQLKEPHETPYWANIKINKIPHSGRESFFVETVQYEEDFYTDELYYLDEKPVREKGAWLLKENFTGGFGKSLSRYKWIIPYKDQLPFRHLSRRELCTKLIAYYEKKGRYTKIADEVSYNKKRVAHVQDYMARTAAKDLDKNAKVRGSMLSAFAQYEDNVPPFYNDPDNNSTYVIDLDPNYFNGSLPLHSPQIFTLEFVVDEKNESVMNNMSKILDALAIENLKTMLGRPAPFSKPYQQNAFAAKPPSTAATKQITTPSNASAKSKEGDKAGNSIKPIASAGKDLPFDPSKPVYDLDSNQYTVLTIGKQCWLKENLRTTKYNDTTAIATGLSNEQWKQTKKGAYSIYENNPLHDKSYGKLYNGYAVATGKLCPKGWRVSTDKDWKELETFIGVPADELDRTGERGDVADKLKTGTGWKSSPFTGNNSSGFSIEPAGARLDNGEYTTISQYGNFWTSTVYDDRYGLLYLWNHHVNYNSNAIGRIYTLANNGYSCRCVLDEKATAKKPAK